ncbi:MAG TPA: CPBP family intramembrane glutamic endopeptidase [Candidatus Dormibacteraeota bacterium]|nr:CPBP family intramembrane glutamic endopeptidase [Candidatus Dormibacteraeota bacterium]
MFKPKITKTDSKKDNWGPVATVLIATFIFFGSQIIVAIFFREYSMVRHWSVSTANFWLTNSVPALFIETFLVELFLILFLYAFMRHKNVSFQSIGIKGKFSFRDLKYTITGFLVYLLIYLSVVSTLQYLIQSFNTSQKQNLGVPSSAQGGNLWLLFVMLVILPPIAEEILFRGFIYTSLRSRINKVIAAVIVSLLFAFPHLFESNNGFLWVAGVDTFTLSMVLVYVREKTDKLWASILIHTLKNFVAFASLYLLHSS